MIGIISNNKINKTRIEILKDVAIFSELEDYLLEELAQNLEEIVFEENTEVFHKGDKLNAMYIIVYGGVTVHDDEHVFTEFGINDFFGEYSLIDSSARSATVTTNKKTQLLKLNQSDFFEVIEKNVEVSKAILKALIKRLRNNNILEEKLTKSKLEIEKQKAKLEELNATKDKFFTIIAHDLKNPFNTVIGLTELLMERYNSYDHNKVLEFIGQINKFSNNAYNLLEDLLQWAKSQTGRMKVNLEKVDLYDLIVENESLIEEKLIQKNIELKIEAVPGENAYVDKNMISAVIRNLLTNAVKFTARNGLIIVKTKKTESYYSVSIIDNGVGINEATLSKIFNIDSNISTHGTEDEIGTGLGLIITKEFIDRNNGTISVTSKEGVGSNFTFKVPEYTEE